MKLTEEQLLIVGSQSKSLAVIAFAGTGKTSTLCAYAQARKDKRFIYLAFNKSMALEAAGKFPQNVTCITTHSLAFRAIGSKYQHKLQADIRATQAAVALKLDPEDKSSLASAKRALLALKQFMSSACMSFDEFMVDDGHDHTNSAIRSAERLWGLMIDPVNAEVPMLHDGYLKLYQLSNPVINFDCILFDEAQDANPVTLAIVKNQKIDKVFVGDPHQQIYQFRHATNAMQDESLLDHLYLTTSFRFNETIASAANSLLQLKKERMLVHGSATQAKSTSTAYITRGNAAIFLKASKLANDAKKFYLVGGVEGYRFELLMNIWRLKIKLRNEIRDPFIKNFKSYDLLFDYANSHNERDVMAFINLLDKHHNVDLIPAEINLIRSMSTTNSSEAHLVLSTAHKSKGLEFKHVDIADDFPAIKLIDSSYEETYSQNKTPVLWSKGKFNGAALLPVEEINLRYVAITRAELSISTPYWGQPLFGDINTFVSKYPNFVQCDSEGDLYRGFADSADREAAPTPKVVDSRDEGYLKELVLKDFSINIKIELSRFNGGGWFSVGKTDAHCPNCGEKSLAGYRKPYLTKNSQRYHYWALFCSHCEQLFEPAKLTSESKKTLKKLAIPVETV